MKNLITELDNLEILAKIYSDMWGPNSEEVKKLQEKMAKINAKILDQMCPE